MTAAIVWAAIRPWLKSLNLWMLVVIAGMGAVIYIGNGKLQERKAAEAAAKVVAGTAVATVTAAAQTATATRQAEAETPADADREYFKRLCGQSASCRSRSKYAGGKP